MLEFNNINELKQFYPAQLVLGNNPQIDYYAYNQKSKRLYHIQIKLSSTSVTAERKRFDQELLKKQNHNFAKGMESENMFDSKNIY